MIDPGSEHDAQAKLTHEDICQLPGESRTVQLSGIEFESLRYQSPALAGLRSYLQCRRYKDQCESGNKQNESCKEKVQIKYDPMDLSTIYVYDPRPEHEDWLLVPVMNQEYTKGLSIDEHKVIRSYILRQKKGVDIYELAVAKKHIQGIVERQFGLALEALVRKKAERYLEIEAKSAPDAESNPLASSHRQTDSRQGNEEE